MSKFLHITNGDGVSNLLKQSSIRGDVLPWRDTMHHGPFPSGFDLDILSEVRAGYLAADSNQDSSDIERDFKQRNQQLRSCGRYQEIILWFEHDLLDQLQILQILDWFALNDQYLSKLKIICINHFEGIQSFRGLGQLNSEQISSLFKSRRSVTREQIILATEGWHAFRSSDPMELWRFIGRIKSPALPFLKKSLMRHFQEYPYTSNGLNRTENQILSLVNQGVSNPIEIFKQNRDLEDCFFIGDWRTYRIIDHLIQYGFLRSDNFRHPPGVCISPDQFSKQIITITQQGEELLFDQLNANDLIDRDIWLGGVNIHSKKFLWLWDEMAKKTVLYAG